MTHNSIRQITANGGNVQINVLDNGLYVDDEGRYWVAIPPAFMNALPEPGMPISEEGMKYGTKIDIFVICQHEGTELFIPAVVGDVKNHSWPEGMYQTGMQFPDGVFMEGHDDKSTIEFIGWNIATDEDGKSIVNLTNNYIIHGIIVHDDVYNYK
jgi:hypothetical protein